MMRTVPQTGVLLNGRGRTSRRSPSPTVVGAADVRMPNEVQRA
jgi:hypothetical protein